MKKAQIAGQKVSVTEEELELQKLIRKAFTLNRLISSHKKDLDDLQSKIVSIAEKRKGLLNSVTMHSGYGSVSVYFRKTFSINPNIEKHSQAFGSMFSKFFDKRITFTATNEFKKFWLGLSDYGFVNSKSLKDVIYDHITITSGKPSVKYKDISQK